MRISGFIVCYLLVLACVTLVYKIIVIKQNLKSAIMPLGGYRGAGVTSQAVNRKQQKTDEFQVLI